MARSLNPCGTSGLGLADGGYKYQANIHGTPADVAAAAKILAPLPTVITGGFFAPNASFPAGGELEIVENLGSSCDDALSATENAFFRPASKKNGACWVTQSNQSTIFLASASVQDSLIRVISYFSLQVTAEAGVQTEQAENQNRLGPKGAKYRRALGLFASYYFADHHPQVGTPVGDSLKSFLKSDPVGLAQFSLAESTDAYYCNVSTRAQFKGKSPFTYAAFETIMGIRHGAVPPKASGLALVEPTPTPTPTGSSLNFATLLTALPTFLNAAMQIKGLLGAAPKQAAGGEGGSGGGGSSGGGAKGGGGGGGGAKGGGGGGATGAPQQSGGGGGKASGGGAASPGGASPTSNPATRSASVGSAPTESAANATPGSAAPESPSGQPPAGGTPQSRGDAATGDPGSQGLPALPSDKIDPFVIDGVDYSKGSPNGTVDPETGDPAGPSTGNPPETVDPVTGDPSTAPGAINPGDGALNPTPGVDPETGDPSTVVDPNAPATGVDPETGDPAVVVPEGGGDAGLVDYVPKAGTVKARPVRH